MRAIGKPGAGRYLFIVFMLRAIDGMTLIRPVKARYLHQQEIDGKITAAMWQGQGCAISMASASMMTGLIRGKSIPEALALVEKFKAMIVDGAEPAPELGDLKALAGVHKLHARVKCATLAWNTLEEALQEAQ